MKFLIVLTSSLWFFATAASATPLDMICSGGSVDDLVAFEIPLITGYSSIYESGVAPLSSYHLRLQYWQDLERKEVEIYGDHMVAQWLLDGRVDLRFYLEEQNDKGEITSYDLIIRTKANGQISLASGQKLHIGQYVFRAYSGSYREGTDSIFIELTGQAECK